MDITRKKEEEVSGEVKARVKEKQRTTRKESERERRKV